MKNPYFPFYVRDWMCSRRVLTMSGDAVKAYLYLMAESWISEPRATLPSNDAELASMARVSLEKWMTIKQEVLQHYSEGKCKDHKGRFYQETLLEISRKSESKQRLGNTNAKRSRIKHKPNAAPEDETETETDTVNAEEIEEIYKQYPSTCPVNESSTGKTPTKNKSQIAKILATEYPLSESIELYQKNCVKAKRYMKNFGTFLNNLPDIDDLRQQNQIDKDDW